MPTEEILSGLHSLPESIWADIKGKSLDDRGLASRLRKYGIKPKVFRIGGSTPRGYSRADLVDAWARYLSTPPVATATSATSATPTELAPVSTGHSGIAMEA
jgi:hypothetical protein